MNKLQVKPTGAFGFHCENLPQAVSQFLRKLHRKTDCDIRTLMRGGLHESSTLEHHSQETQRAILTFKGLNSGERRLLSLATYKHNMVAVVRNIVSKEQRDILPHILIAYPVGRRMVVANTHQVVDRPSEAEAALQDEIELKLAR